MGFQTTEKVKYICVKTDIFKKRGETQNPEDFLTQECLVHIMDAAEKELKRTHGWLKIDSGDKAYYYNCKVRGLFPDFSKAEYTKPPLMSSETPNIERELLAGMHADLVTKEELAAAFTSVLEDVRPFIEDWGWDIEMFNQYYSVNSCENHGEVCRIDGGKPAYWGIDVWRKACVIPIVHLEKYVSDVAFDKTFWEDDILFLIKKELTPVLDLEDKEEDKKILLEHLKSAEQKGSEDVFPFTWKMLEQAKESGKSVFQKAPADMVIKPDEKEMEQIREDLCLCDRTRVNLLPYDANILSPANGHWDLWKYNSLEKESLPSPPEGKVWADVSDKDIYARNAAEDIASSAEMVAVDFGTKSSTVARRDNQNNIDTIPVGEYSAQGEIKESGYENPTILKYINFDSFLKAYRNAAGRPETNFNDLSASYTAQKEFEERILTDNENDIFAYHYQIKQWAYDNEFAPLLFDSHRRIGEIKPYLEIEDGDYDPIEIYAYLVGANIVNMHSQKICLRYLLSYPPSCDQRICEKIRKSFERGIRKAIPVEAQETEEFKDNFSVQLWQSEPAAYAVCAIKEFGIIKTYADTPVFCGVYDLGGGTVDYHFGGLSSGNPPYQYEEFANGGNPRLGCENILEELAYEVFSANKDILIAHGLKYKYPPQYPKNLRDTRYTSDSGRASLNTLNMIDKLRELWIANFKESNGQLCYFEAYKDNGEQCYIKVMAGQNEQPQNPASSKEVTIFAEVEYLKNFFRERLKKTIEDFFRMMDETLSGTGWYEKDAKNVIFLAGNGSRSHMVTEIFQECIAGNSYLQENCDLYEPLSTEGAKEKGQKIQGRSEREIPNAKTGVAYGLLLSCPGSNFIKISKSFPEFIFKYTLGDSRYDVDKNENMFYPVRKPDGFKLCKKKDQNLASEDRAPFELSEDGYLHFWYTDASPSLLDGATIGDCNAMEYSRKIPEAMPGAKCFFRAVSETELELLIESAETDVLRNYGVLDLKNGKFQKYEPGDI